MPHAIWLVAVWVVVGLYAVTGLVAVTTGRAVPWQRGYILRPRLWGSGTLVFGGGMALAWYAGRARDLTYSDAVFACSMLMMISGGVLQHLGQRVGRSRG